MPTRSRTRPYSSTEHTFNSEFDQRIPLVEQTIIALQEQLECLRCTSLKCDRPRKHCKFVTNKQTK